MPGLHLRSVSFAGCREEIASTVPAFIRQQLGLIALNLDNLQSLKDEVVCEIYHLLPGLRECSVRGCSRFLDLAALPFFLMPCLRKLCLSSCLSITNVAFLAVAQMPSPVLELRSLDLSLTQIRRDLLNDLLVKTPRLLELDVSGCDVSDTTLVHLCETLTGLRALALRGCIEVSDHGLLLGICQLKGLVRLDLRLCLNISPGAIAEYVSCRPFIDLKI